jgi:hypothetical protein
MRKLFEESHIMNEGIMRQGFKRIERSCGECAHFEEGDRFAGDLDQCVFYGLDWKGPRDAIYAGANNVCNLWKKDH